MTVEEKLQELGIELRPLSKPVANYLHAKKFGNLIYCSGCAPVKDGKNLYTGKLGTDLTVEQGYDAAREAAINLLSVLKYELGSLDRVTSIVKILGFVASAEDFYAQPAVINGASDLLVEVFGEKGQHARAAIGTNAIPGNLPVEIELIAEFQ